MNWNPADKKMRYFSLSVSLVTTTRALHLRCCTRRPYTHTMYILYNTCIMYTVYATRVPPR